MSWQRDESPRNFLTVDVEDYFQVAAFESVVRQAEWKEYESRVEANTDRLLALFEQYDVRATFFVVGWIGEQYPALIRKIRDLGHEIGCHSYLHRRIYDLGPEEFFRDTKLAKEILEQASGEQVVGYRAPTYTITRKSYWALEILNELDFTYDSSIFPIRHDNYGIPDAPRFPYQVEGMDLIEFPISTALICGRKIPVAGGGYFRLFPLWFTLRALKRINRVEGKPFVFYVHPWEVDPGQPRFESASRLSRFRHYTNLDKTMDRLHILLRTFRFQPIRAAACLGAG